MKDPSSSDATADANADTTSNATVDARTDERTHRDLMPADLCQHLMFKQILNEGLDEPAGEDRTWPGDGYYWCMQTLHDIGPDDELVEPPLCRGERGCCESLES